MEEENKINENLLAFLDAKTHDEKINVLMSVEGIDDDLINKMALSMGIVIRNGKIEERVEELKKCLQTMGRYESDRLR